MPYFNNVRHAETLYALQITHSYLLAPNFIFLPTPGDWSLHIWICVPQQKKRSRFCEKKRKLQRDVSRMLFITILNHSNHVRILKVSDHDFLIGFRRFWRSLCLFEIYCSITYKFLICFPMYCYFVKCEYFSFLLSIYYS